LEITDTTATPGTRLFKSPDTWELLTLLPHQGRGYLKAPILGNYSHYCYSWDSAVYKPRYLGITDTTATPGTRLFKSPDTWELLTLLLLQGRGYLKAPILGNY